jgi:hypothetical protein
MIEGATCLQSERRIIEESKKAPMTAPEQMRNTKQRRQVEASISRSGAATPDASSQAIDVDSETGPMECGEKQADDTFENRVLAYITHWRLATEHFGKSFYCNKLRFVCGVSDYIWFQNYLKRSRAVMLQFLQ